MTAKMVLIAAVGHEGALGYEGKLPWPLLRHDMELFQLITKGAVCLVGKNTLDSLPPGGLKGRKLVLLCEHTKTCVDFGGCAKLNERGVIKAVSNVVDALEFVRDMPEYDGPLVVIGGAQTYAAAIRAAEWFSIPTSVIINRIHVKTPHDVKFPLLSGCWRQTYRGIRRMDRPLDKTDRRGYDTRMLIFNNF